MIFFKYFLLILAGTSFLSACEEINEKIMAEHKTVCSEYGYAANSSQFIKCVERQNIIAKYENENWLLLTLGLK